MKNPTKDILQYLDDIVGADEVEFLITKTPAAVVKHLFLMAVRKHNVHFMSVRYCALWVYGNLIDANIELHKQGFRRTN